MSTVHRLDGGSSTLLVSAGTGAPQCLYFGERLPQDFSCEGLSELIAPITPYGELDLTLATPLYPADNGLPQFLPALSITVHGQERLCNFGVVEIRSHTSSLVLELCEPDLGLALELRFESCDSGVFTSQTRLVNNGTETVSLLNMASLHLPLPSRHDELMRFTGFWANEQQTQRALLGASRAVVESRRGRSSHGSAPSVLLGTRGFSEQRGELVAAALSYSGDHRITLERAADGSVQLTAGVPLRAGDVTLGPGDSHTPPAALFASTDLGMNGIREQFRRYWQAQKPEHSTLPVHFNSWEACYFDHDQHSMRALIDEAAQLGAERFILDDGWMAGRSRSGVGLGDWQPCPQRYPDGLAPIASHAREKGLEFGLWVEPEMVTPDSELAHRHPDWTIGVPQLPPVSGREQYLLDIARPEVRSAVLARLQAVLDQCRPDIIKWDMNRDYAQTSAESRSARALHAGFEALVAAVKAANPALQIEICAAGGARTDCGALRHGDRIWPSDSMDPLQRFDVIRNASLFLAPTRLGAHVGSRISSTSGRYAPMSTRCAVAMLGHFGLEVSPATLDTQERETLRLWIGCFKEHRGWLHRARREYLDTGEDGLRAIIAHSEDGDRALLWILRSAPAERGATTLLRLPGLAADSRYAVRLLNREDSAFVQRRSTFLAGTPLDIEGAVLSLIGLRAPALQTGHCAVFELLRHSE